MTIYTKFSLAAKIRLHEKFTSEIFYWRKYPDLRYYNCVHAQLGREIVNWLVLEELSMYMDSTYSIEHEYEEAKSSWAIDYSLQLCGQYYEGFVDDYELITWSCL